MKKSLLIAIVLLANLSTKAQQYVQYMDINGQLHISNTAMPQVSIDGLFSSLLSIPTTISGYGITDGVSTGSTYANPAWITSLAWSKLTGVPSFATVATTGAYSDLTGKPTNVSTFTNDAGYLTASSVPNLLTKTANYTITGSDFASGKPAILHVWVDCTSSNVTLTLPSASTFAGYFVTVGKTDNTANTLTISGCSYDNIITVQNSVKELYSTSSTWKQN